MQASLLGRAPVVGLAATQRRPVLKTHAASASARSQAAVPLKV